MTFFNIFIIWLLIKAVKTLQRKGGDNFSSFIVI